MEQINAGPKEKLVSTGAKEDWSAMDVKVWLDQVKIRKEVRQGCLLPILFNLYSKYLTKEYIEGTKHIKDEDVSSYRMTLR